MKLKTVQVTNFKSIDDSSIVKITDITCLVGKNESGKTSFLRALHKLNPVSGISRDFSLLDYPRKNYALYKKKHETNPAQVVLAEFELEDNEIDTLEQSFGAGILPSRLVKCSKNYKNQTGFDFVLDEAAPVRHRVNSSDLPTGIRERALQCKNLKELAGLLDEMADRPPSMEQFRLTIVPEASKDLRGDIESTLLGWMPEFLYFDDYSAMKGRISIQQLKVTRDQKKLSDSDRTFLSLLSLLDAKLEDFEIEQNYDRLKAELEAASNRITDEVFRFWKQNRQLEVEFDISQANPQDPAPLNQGTILHVRIKNNRHRVTVPFDDRSRGFIWFFSFLAYFQQFEEKKSDVILLLDEPGLSLHAMAQGDFLGFIEERLAPNHQVLYTTHSPFMIDANRLERVRTVQDEDNKGTVVSDNVLRNDKDTVFPLQAALGFELAQTLFVGPNCLLVEGPSDLIYLKILSEACAAQGMDGLDPRWVLVPVGGADKISTFVSLLGGQKLNIAVLMDVSNRDQQRIQNLQSNALLGKSSLIQLSEITGAKESDIEDIFEPDFYLSIVNTTYKADLPAALTTADLPTITPRIIKRLDKVFREKGYAGGNFSHYKPSVTLLNDQASFVGKLGTDTLNRASRLFGRVNRLL